MLFFTVIPSVYIKRIFSSLFTDGYSKGIFIRKHSPQYIYENILSVYPFLFIIFLVVMLKDKKKNQS